jgi:hypothetical protein
MKATRIAWVTLTLLLVAGLASAQDRKKLPADEEDLYTVSAKIGVLNVVEGDVSYKREQADWARLVAGDDLREGDAVKTGATGRAEILLTPGCYLRLAENSTFILTNPHVYQFRVDLTSGSAIIEASAIDGPMTVATPKNEFSIIKEGLYRFNIAADGRAEVIIRKGRVAIGNTVVKENKRATVENGQPLIGSFDKKGVDNFDLWSQERARGLIALNKRLSKSTLSNNASFGFVSNAWIYSRRCGCYTFLPFGSGFSSPYGWDYSVCNPFWNGYSYYPGYSWGGWRNGNNGSGSGNGGSGTGSGGGHRHKPGRGDSEQPGFGLPRPPVRTDSDNRYNPPSRAEGGHHHNSPSRSDSSPRYSPPASMPSMPASSPSSSSSAGGGGHHHKNN